MNIKNKKPDKKLKNIDELIKLADDCLKLLKKIK